MPSNVFLETIAYTYIRYENDPERMMKWLRGYLYPEIKDVRGPIVYKLPEGTYIPS